MENRQLGEKARKRTVLICTTCQKHEVEAAKASANGRVYIRVSQKNAFLGDTLVYMANGVRADSGERLRQAVDHLTSRAHAAAVEADKFQCQWENQSEKHPWVSVLSKD